MADKPTRGMDVDDGKDDKKEEPTKGAPMAVDSDDDEETVPDLPPTKDVEEAVNIIIAEIESQGGSGSALTAGLEKLLSLEKKQRQNEHEANTMFIALAMLDSCRRSGDWKLTNEQIAILSRRRSQFRRVTMRMVQHAMKWLDDDETVRGDKALRLKLIETLRTVTEGKIFVEVERARLTKRWAAIKEHEDGDVAGACDILQELQIETFGSMRKREKSEFLLEQFRLNLAKKDFVRAAIVRNKMTLKVLRRFGDLELRYWNLSLILFYHDGRQFLELSKSYFRLRALLKSTKEQVQALSNGILALILAKRGNEERDLLHRTVSMEKKLLEQTPLLRQLVVMLTTSELIRWPLSEAMMERVGGFKFVGVVDEEQSDLMDRVRDKVIEHNIGVVAGYYERISTKRLSQFVAIDEAQTEQYVSKMVTEKELFARINRLDGIIRFRRKQTENEMLNEWKADTDRLLDLVDLTCHHIHKETVVHKQKGKAKAKGKGKGKR